MVYASTIIQEDSNKLNVLPQQLSNYVSSKNELKKVLKVVSSKDLVVLGKRSSFFCYVSNKGKAKILEHNDSRELFGSISGFTDYWYVEHLNKNSSKDSFIVYNLPRGWSQVNEFNSLYGLVDNYLNTTISLMELGLVTEKFRGTDFVTNGQNVLRLNTTNIVPLDNPNDLISHLAYELAVLKYERLISNPELCYLISHLLMKAQVSESLLSRFSDRFDKLAKFDNPKLMQENVLLDVINSKVKIMEFMLG